MASSVNFPSGISDSTNLAREFIALPGCSAGQFGSDSNPALIRSL